MTEVVRATLDNWQMIQKDDGRIYLRRPGYPDGRLPYSAEHAEVCISSAVYKHGWTPVRKIVVK